MDISSGTVIVNSILWNPNSSAELGGSLNVTYSTILGGYHGTGNLSLDPRFVDQPNDDFHIKATSPCIDSGTNTQKHLHSADFEGDPRKHLTTIDMGADEFYPRLYHTGLSSPGKTISVRLVGPPYSVVFWSYSLNPALLTPPMSIPGLTGQFELNWPFFLCPLSALDIDGLFSFSFAFPPSFPVPNTFPTQALIGLQMTNADVVKVK